MVGVFSGVIEDLAHRTKQGPTDNEAPAQLIRLVEVTSIMFARDPVCSGCKNRCVGRWIGGGIGHVSMQKCLQKGGSIWLRDSTLITAFFTDPLFSFMFMIVLD